MKQGKLLLIFILALTSSRLFAQDPQFSQFFANKLLLSSAFAGSADGPRLAMNFRNQWPRIPNNYLTTAVSFDMPFYFGGQSRVPRHGMGINLMGDQAGAGVLRKIDANFNYSFLISLGRDYDHNIRLGVSAGIQQASLDFFRLRFPDQFGPDGSQLPTQELFDGGNRIHEEIGAGFVYYNKIFYMGANVRHLTQPQQTFINSNAPNAQLPMHFAAFTGLNIPLNAQKPNGPSISPAFMFRYQQPFTQIDLGLYANLDPIVIGTWYRWDDAVIFLVGLQRGQFSVGYSYDLTVSDLTNAASGGAHEVSVVVTFDGPGRKAKRPTAKMSCPRF